MQATTFEPTHNQIKKDLTGTFIKLAFVVRMCHPYVSSILVIKFMLTGTLLILFFTSDVLAASCISGQENYQNEQNQEDCRDCVAGLYSDTNKANNNCTRCGPGKVSLLARAISCEECPPGKISYGVGKDESCKNCTKGKYQSESGFNYCSNCKPGQYTDTASTINCDSCPQGLYQAEAGHQSCVQCPAGFHSWMLTVENEKDYAKYANSTCEGCAKGKYGDQQGSINNHNCKNCTAGRYSVVTGLGYAPEFTAKRCEPCLYGTWSSDVGLDDLTGCTSCKVGFYNEAQGASSQLSCIECAAGRYMEKFGSYNDKDCIRCPRGYYQSEPGKPYCLPCKQGQYNPQKGKTTCRACSPGKYELYPASSSKTGCTLAPIGTYTVGGGVALINVPDGFRSAQCANNKDQHNASGCEGIEKCDSGTHSSTLNGISTPNGICSGCSPGYVSLGGTTNCQACAKGQYQEYPSQRECVACPSGYIQKEEKQIACDECRSGTFADKNGTSECLLCSPGQYQNEKSLDRCNDCPSGYSTFSKTTRKYLTSCFECVLGKYTDGQTGSKDCSFIPSNVSIPPPMLKSLTSIDRNTSRLALNYHIHFQCFMDGEVGFEENPWGVVSVLIQYSTQPNLADQSKAIEHKDWRSQTKKIITIDDLSADENAEYVSEYNSNNKLIDVGYAQTIIIDAHDLYEGPVWQQPIYLRAAYKLKNGATSAWTIENTMIPLSSDCRESEGQQYYLRTHPQDNTCEDPIDMLTANSNTSNIRCIPCPEGGSCNSPKALDAEGRDTGVGVLLWDIAPKKGWWRIPWAPAHGDLKNTKGELIQAPQWFHKCPHEEACLGVTPGDKFGVEGWVSTSSFVSLADQTLETYIAYKTVEHINNGRNWTCPFAFPRSKCLQGTEGPLCELCINGYTRINGICVECFNTETRVLLLTVVLVALFFLVLWVRTFCRKLKPHALVAARDVSKILIILINMGQVVTSIPNMIRVQWPKNVIAFLDHFDIVNIDLASLTGATCENSINFHIRFLSMAACPPIIITIACAMYVFERWKIYKHRGDGLETAQSQSEEVSIMFADETRRNAMNRKLELQQCYIDLFKCIDIDESGTINAVELVELLRLLGYTDPRINEALASKLLQRIGNSTYYESISQFTFTMEMQTGTLSRRLHELLFVEGQEEIYHSEFILKWNRRRKLISYSFGWAMHLLLLLHTPISRKVFQFFDCIQIGPLEYSKSFLSVDYSIQCQDGLKNVDSYNEFMFFVILTCACYTLLLPVLILCLLYKKRNILYTPLTIQTMGWMYERLAKGSEWWDVHEILRKMILCGVLVFFPTDPGLRAAMALCICIVSQSLLNYWKPHRNNLVFWTEQMAMSVVVLLYAFAIVLSSNLSLKDQDDLGGWIIAAIIVLLFGGAVTASLAIYWVYGQVELDRKDPNVLKAKLHRAVKKVPHYKETLKETLEVQATHRVTSAFKNKRISAKKILAKDRLAKRLKKRQRGGLVSGILSATDKIGVVQGFTGSLARKNKVDKKVESIRMMMSNVFQTPQRFKSSAERLNWTAIGIVQYDVFHKMVSKLFLRMTKEKIDEALVQTAWAAAAGGDGTKKVMDIDIMITWLELSDLKRSSNKKKKRGKAPAKKADFQVGMNVLVYVDDELKKGRIEAVSVEEGVAVAYSDGTDDEYTVKKLKKIIALGKEKQELQERGEQ